MISGIDSYYVGQDGLRPARDDSKSLDQTSLDSGPVDDTKGGPQSLQAPVDVDAAPYDAGSAGYTDLSGEWAGNWIQDFTLVGGGVTLTFEQDGGTLTGPLEITGGACPGSGTMTGKFVAPDKTAGTYRSDDGLLVLNLTSTISADGKTLNGRFQSVGTCLPGAFGTTKITRSSK
jgi:hypothetical protein